MTTKYAGREGMFWWVGTVENRMDPLQLGRVQVRVFNIHTQDKALLPTELLPWASIINSSTSAGLNGVGLAPTGLLPGSTVFGFFADGDECQLPLVWGSLGANNDVNKLAQGTNIINNTQLGPEPDLAYGAQYPFNKPYVSENGIIIELDDTPDNRRIHIRHPSGTYIEINEQGRLVVKGVDDSFEIVQNDKTLYVKGTLTIHVEGDAKINVDGDLTADVGGSANITSQGLMSIAASGITVTADASLDFKCGGATTFQSTTFTVEGTIVNVLGGGLITLEGPAIHLNGVVVTVDGIDETNAAL